MMNVHDYRRGVCPLLGPSLYVWVQGCPLRCKGCFNPETLPFTRANELRPEALLDPWRKAGPGLVLSGGEPFSQALELARLCRLVRAQCSTAPVLAYTGHALEELLNGESDWLELLQELDVLVDGPFIDTELCDHPLLGSSNQRVFLFGHRVALADLERLRGPQVQISWDAPNRLRLVGTGGRKLPMIAIGQRLAQNGVKTRRHVDHDLGD